MSDKTEYRVEGLHDDGSASVEFFATLKDAKECAEDFLTDNLTVTMYKTDSTGELVEIDWD